MFLISFMLNCAVRLSACIVKDKHTVVDLSL